MIFKRHPFVTVLWLMSLLLLLALSSCGINEAEPTATAVPTAESAIAVPTAVPITTLLPPATATIPPAATNRAAPEPTAVSAPAAIAYFEEAACEFSVLDGREVTCGWLTVPEERSDPDNDRTIQLHVAIFASESSNPAPDPIVYLEGGPGGDALETVPLTFERYFAPYLAHHNFIMFDQRGTGYSRPSLACPESKELIFELLDQDIAAAEGLSQSIDALLACRDRLIAAGENLAAYNSAANAADLDDLRQALGYEEWNLLGISYGTRLAQTAMRDRPQGLRSVILDSTYPLQVNLLTDTPANVARAFAVLFAGCQADPACHAAYPELETVFYETVAQLNQESIIIPVTHLLNGNQYDVYFAGDELLGILFESLYATTIIPDLPQLIYDVNKGDYTNLSLLFSSFLSNVEFFSAGMHFSVQCFEENRFTNIENVAAATLAFPELAAIFEYSPILGPAAITICESWGAGEADPIENEPITTEIPTLILAGEYDPITPPAWGRLLNDALPNSTFYEFPGTGHGVSISGACAVSVIASFLADPAAVPEAGCLADMAGPVFTVPNAAGETVTLVPFTNDLFGIEGIVPAGWEEISPGTYSRGRSGLDQTLFIQQASPDMSADQLLELLSTQLGWEAVPESTGLYEADARSWTLYEADVQGLPATIALSEADGVTLLALLISAAGEHTFLFEAVMIPALAALTVP